MPFFISEHAPGADRSGFKLVSVDSGSRPSESHLAVCPPQLFSRARPSWQRVAMRMWLWLTLHPQRVESLRPISTRLQKVRERFLDLLVDVTDMPPADTLRMRIEKARSLRELWHLRADAYDLLSRFGGENLARQRLDVLNDFFPTRVPQAGRCRPDSGRTVAW